MCSDEHVGFYRNSNNIFNRVLFMIEFLKHSLGLCGETHPNFIMFMLGEMNINFNLIFYQIKTYTYNIIAYMK